ncbi:AgrD family cyclic lactone autoinducer peptide [Tissierella praeacuta]
MSNTVSTFLYYESKIPKVLKS